MSTSPAVSRSARVSWWPASGLMALVGAASLVTRADVDLWGHVRFGLDMLATRSLPLDDPYSFTQDKPWINHEWLSELVMGWAYAVGGPVGLVLLKGALVSATLAVIWTAFRQARIEVQLGALLVLVAGTLQVTSPLRPQLWTFLSLAILSRTLVDPDVGRRRWLPVLFAVWANTHGGWVVGCGVLVAWAAGECLRSPASRRQWLWLLPACIAGTLMTPYGTTLWTFVLTTVRPGRQIVEWMPLWASSKWYWIGWTAAVLVAVVSLARRSPDRLSRALVLAMLAYGGLTVMRITPLFLEVALVLAAGEATRVWPASFSPVRHRRSAGQVGAGALLVAAPALLAFRLGDFATGCIPPLPSAAFDVPVVQALSRTEGRGRLVTHFDWGEYALWHLGPRLKVSIDGRRETIYSDAHLVEHAAIITGAPEGLAMLADWNAEYVWLPAMSRATREWLEGHGYRIDFTGPRSFLAVRADLPALAVASAPARRCFPL